MRSRFRILTLVGSALLLGSFQQAARAEAPERLFLQQVGTNTAIVKWRGDADQACWAKQIRSSQRQLLEIIFGTVCA